VKRSISLPGTGFRLRSAPLTSVRKIVKPAGAFFHWVPQTPLPPLSPFSPIL